MGTQISLILIAEEATYLTWYVDSGYSRHMKGNKELLFEYEKKIGGGSVTISTKKDKSRDMV